MPDHCLSELLCFAVREEMGVDEAVDERLAGRVDLVELDAHADAAVAPGDVTLGVDVALRAGHAEPHLDRRALSRGLVVRMAMPP